MAHTLSLEEVRAQQWDVQCVDYDDDNDQKLSNVQNLIYYKYFNT